MLANKDYLYVALCDEELCYSVTEMLKPLFALLQEDALLTFSTLFSSLKMVSDKTGEACCAAAEQFLLDIYGLGGCFEDGCKKLHAQLELEPDLCKTYSKFDAAVKAPP